MNLHGQSFVGKQLRKGKGESFQAVSPLNSSPLEPAFFKVGDAEVNDALTLAENAFGQYGRTSGSERAAFLERIGEEIMNLGDELIQRANQETGLPEARLTGERLRTVNQLKMFAEVAREGSWVDARIDTAIPDRKPLPKPDLRRMLVPLGPIVVFGSSNFPLAFSVAGGDTASALATGNTVVIKAHSGHPGTSELVATAVLRAVQACGLPDGVFSMLHGSGKEMGTALVRHPKTRAVGFTGSRTAGRALFDAAAARPEPIPVFAEMSSLNPVFILPEALRERGAAIAEALKASLTLGVGQFCTKPGLIFGLNGKDLYTFGSSLAKAIEAAAPATMLHAGIHKAYKGGAERVAASKAVSVLARSQQVADSAKTQAGAIVVLTDLVQFQQHPELAEEVFGPFGVLIAAPDMAAFEKAAGELEGQLTATLHGTAADLKNASRLIEILQKKAGRLVINCFPTGVEVCPSMHHGGPYPSTTDVRFTSVGTAALYRFVRPVCYQDFPASLLPEVLTDENPLGIHRTVNGKLVR